MSDVNIFVEGPFSCQWILATGTRILNLRNLKDLQCPPEQKLWFNGPGTEKAEGSCFPVLTLEALLPEPCTIQFTAAFWPFVFRGFMGDCTSVAFRRLCPVTSRPQVTVSQAISNVFEENSQSHFN